MNLAGVNLLLVGAGKMGGAMLAGWLDGGVKNVTVFDPAPPADMAALIAAHDLTLNPDAITAPDVAVIAVKPQVMDAVLPTIAPHLGPETLVVSVAAGKTIAGLARHLRGGQPIIRTIPNTPSAIGRGMTVMVANQAADTDARRILATTLLSACGRVAWIDDEAQMDAVTAVSGSGPAYVFLLAEAMAAAGVAAGLDKDLATTIARETVAGAGELLHQSDVPAATLRQNVTSPGGTTAAALSVLMGDDALQKLMTAAVAAAEKRGRDLAG